MNRSWEAPVLGLKRCGGTRRMNIVTGTFSGAWRRVVSPMEVFPPYKIDWETIYLLVVVLV